MARPPTAKARALRQALDDLDSRATALTLHSRAKMAETRPGGALSYVHFQMQFFATMIDTARRALSTAQDAREIDCVMRRFFALENALTTVIADDHRALAGVRKKTRRTK